MRKTTLMIAALLGLAAVPAFAQMATTQSPPSPNSSEAGVQSNGSLPRSAETLDQYNTPGSALNEQQTVPSSQRATKISVLKTRLNTAHAATGTGDFETASANGLRSMTLGPARSSKTSSCASQPTTSGSRRRRGS